MLSRHKQATLSADISNMPICFSYFNKKLWKIIATTSLSHFLVKDKNSKSEITIPIGHLST